MKLDTLKLREVAGSFTTGVTVVTVEQSDGSIHGMTANSFLSVSLDPPLVLFSVINETAILEHIQINSKIAITILNENQSQISNKFAGIDVDSAEIKFISADQYHIIDEGIAWYKTRVNQIIEAGDHQLIICEIIELDKSNNNKPLLYFGGYRQLGSSL